MKTTPFLQQVARHYMNAEHLEDYCFVFPNRRSGQFFTHYLQRELVDADMASGSTAPHLMPCVTSINDLVAQFTSTTAATDIDMLFALYKAYSDKMGENAQEFDRFIYWAQLITGDFNDIDRSLNDAHQVYCNLNDLHELSTNYLTDEVAKKVQRIFGDNLFTAFFDKSADADLWQRGNKSGGEAEVEIEGKVKEEFMSLWNALAAIYDGYHKELDSKGLVSPGKQLRLAAEQPPQDVPYGKLVFVAFGVLSAAEVKLFDYFKNYFKNEGKAEFWWDNAGLQCLHDKAPNQPGVLLIEEYCKRFEAKEIDAVEHICSDISVVAVPSSVGQAKAAMGNIQGSAGIETAVVLPDEGLLVPLLHSMGGIQNLNVTLGYPLRSAGIVSLMHIVSRMHNQAIKERDGWTYYREDVYDILSHPIIKRYFTRDAFTLKSNLSVSNPFKIPATEFKDRGFSDLFIPAGDSELTDAKEAHKEYIDHLLNFCNLLGKEMQDASGAGKQNDDDEKSDVDLPLQQAFLVMYIDVLNQLKCALTDCGQSLQRKSVFYLIDRLASSAVVPFSGEPLNGLQIMGLLETRGLDFKHIVMLSANEGILPRHRSINSFIPNYIRRAYGMSTTEQQDAVMAYNFYRLLNRAESVTLIYDSSTQDTSPGEPSRYITQLEKVYDLPLKHIKMTTKVNTSDAVAITVPNDGETVRGQYTRDPETEDAKYLSASVINKFIMCPLQFYLNHVQNLNDDNDVSDFMDAGEFGSIVHDTLMDCYYMDQKQRDFTADDIKNFQDNRLDDRIVYNIKRRYLHQDKPDGKPLEGEAFMLVDTIKSYVNFVLDYDKKVAPFTILECETKHKIRNLKIGSQEFNFTYLADRIDRLADGTLRIVDYKTGSDETWFSDKEGLPDLFEPTTKDRRKAVLQLMLYCYAYILEHPNDEHGNPTKIQPVIYKIKSMSESGVFVGKSTDNYVFSLDDGIAKMFLEEMEKTIGRIYTEGFKQAPVELTNKHCIYCRFVDFCRRTPHEAKY